ncbi:MAG: hypothetical protein HRT97_10150 [Moritella sp.]|uniref:hypothetical protein n=1 Tax=Moritella sp. TaxID=78556 RepID=UPI0025E82619|nr:hypothetical protein [Moritella sp.]NQZ92688.1 hypothetical protein [Moritella sp.]
MKPFLSKLTTKQLLVIITILLVVVGSPIIINAFDYVSRNVAKLVISNKESFCAREYPARTVKALTQSEFDTFVAKEVATISTTDTYNFFVIGKYKSLPDVDAMKLYHNWKLTGSNSTAGVYRGGNVCESGGRVRIHFGEDIPWYYF